MVTELIHVDSPNVSYNGDQITVNYEYATTSVRKIENRLVVSDKRRWLYRFYFGLAFFGRLFIDFFSRFVDARLLNLFIHFACSFVIRLHRKMCR